MCYKTGKLQIQQIFQFKNNTKSFEKDFEAMNIMNDKIHMFAVTTLWRILTKFFNFLLFLRMCAGKIRKRFKNFTLQKLKNRNRIDLI